MKAVHISVCVSARRQDFDETRYPFCTKLYRAKIHFGTPKRIGHRHGSWTKHLDVTCTLIRRGGHEEEAQRPLSVAVA